MEHKKTLLFRNAGINCKLLPFFNFVPSCQENQQTPQMYVQTGDRGVLYLNKGTESIGFWRVQHPFTLNSLPHVALFLSSVVRH